MKISDAQERVIDALRAEACDEDGRMLVRMAVRATVEAIGFHVSADGEICDPRPKKEAWTPPSPANWRKGRR